MRSHHFEKYRNLIFLYIL